MNDSWYDTAQICTNGHVINESSISSPQFNQKFCRKCGAPTVTNCRNCNVAIKGEYHVPHSPINVIHVSPPKPPGFCHQCGKPYPWTEAALKAAQELSDEVDNLTPEERELLKKSLDDIVRDTPQTEVAATRFKKIVAKAGKVAVDGFKVILFDVASEAAKRIIWP